MNILVTGCAGYLGSHLIAVLESQGHQVFGVDLFATKRALDTTIDLTVEGAAADLMKGIEVVVHTAAIHPWKQYTDDEYLDNNVKPVYYVLQSAAQAGVRRVVYTSSIAAIGYHPTLEALPLKETAPARPGELYGSTKWFGEVFCQMFSSNTSLETVCLRPPAFMPKPEIDRGLALLGLWADVSDVASAHVAAVGPPCHPGAKHSGQPTRSPTPARTPPSCGAIRRRSLRGTGPGSPSGSPKEAKPFSPSPCSGT